MCCSVPDAGRGLAPGGSPFELPLRVRYRYFHFQTTEGRDQSKGAAGGRWAKAGLALLIPDAGGEAATEGADARRRVTWLTGRVRVEGSGPSVPAGSPGLPCHHQGHPDAPEDPEAEVLARSAFPPKRRKIRRRKLGS